MDNNISEKRKKFNSDKLVFVLMIVTLGLVGLSFILSFFNYELKRSMAEGYLFFYTYDYSYELTFAVPRISDIFPLLFSLTAAVLLFIYVLKLYPQGKGKPLFTAVLGVVGLDFVRGAINDFLSGDAITILLGILILAIAVYFILLAVFWQIDKLNKTLIKIGFVAVGVISLLSVLGYFISVGVYMSNKMYFYIFSLLVSVLASICLYLTPILFLFFKGASNSAVTASIAISPEEELFALNEKLALGMITEEEYNLLRADIIQRL